MANEANVPAHGVWYMRLLVFGVQNAVRLTNPTFEVRPIAYARAALVGAVVAIGGGALWGLVNLILINLGLVIFASSALPGLVVGYAAGELVNAAVNAKRSKGLAYITGGSVVGAFVLAQILYSGHVGFFGLIVLAVALYVAVQRVK